MGSVTTLPILRQGILVAVFQSHIRGLLESVTSIWSAGCVHLVTSEEVASSLLDKNVGIYQLRALQKKKGQLSRRDNPILNDFLALGFSPDTSV